MKRLTLAALTAAFALASCAVLTVDVDVYKGPLANHEDVQMEQLATMAVGARPLLVRLRNDLEDGYRKANSAPSTCGCVDSHDQPKPRCYADQPYVQDPGCLTSPDARMVNAILGLYLNQENSLIGKLVAEGREIFEEATQVRLELDDFDSDRALWQRIEEAREKAKCIAPTGSEEERRSKAVKEALYVEKTEQYRKVDLLSAELTRRGEDAQLTVATEKFARLTRVEEVGQIVSGVLPAPEQLQLRDEVTRRIVRIGELFLRGRELLDRGLVVSLELIALLDSGPDTIPNRKELIDLASDVASSLVHVGRSSAAYGLLKTEGANSLAPSALDSVLNAQEPNEAHRTPAAEQIKQRQTQLASLLKVAPVETAMALKAIHLQAKRAAAQDAARGSARSRTNSGSSDLVYGIAIAMTMDDSAAAQLETTLARFESLTVLARELGFQRGRLEKGLDSLVEDYLHERDKLAAEQEDSASLVVARRKLTDELTHFAEKVLFVVNHDAVLRACKGGDGECRESYVMVLESVGNSILTLNDDLHHRWSHDNESDPEAAKREVNAARAAWTQESAAHFDDLVRAVLSADAVIPETIPHEDRDKARAGETTAKALDKKHEEAVQTLDKAKQEQKASADKQSAAERSVADAQELVKAWNVKEVKAAKDKWINGCSGSNVSLHERIHALIDELTKARKGLDEDEDELSRAMTAAIDDATARLKDPKRLPDTPKVSCPDAFKAMRTLIDEDVKSRETVVAKAKSNADADKKRVDTLTKAEEEAKTAWSTAVADAAKAKTDYENALAARKVKSAELIQRERNFVLGKALPAPGEPRAGRRRVVALLVERLRNLAQEAKDKPADQKDLELAANLAEAQPVSDLPDVTVDDQAKTPTAVLDQVTATLRQARVAALASGSTQLAAQLKRALTVAEQSRSPMVYIRPATSYLRNSSAITTLQDNQVGWRNMLIEDTALRATPDKAAVERAKTQAAIDKQFWQNINRVRVTGGGDTTYALVKDDIGNWYVKGYVGDPKVVIKGVQAMALAAASGGMKTDLLQRVDDMAQAKLTGKPLEKKSSVTVLGKQIDHFAQVYDDATEKHATELKKETDGLAAKVKSAWSDKLASNGGLLTKDANAMSVVVDDAAKAAFDKAPAAVPDKKGREQAEFCADLLKRTADLEEKLLDGCPKSLVNSQPADTARDGVKKAEAKLLAATTETEIQSAKDELTKARAALEQAEKDVVRAQTLVHDLRRVAIDVVGGVAQKFADRRADAIEDYETALGVLGQRPTDESAAPSTAADAAAAATATATKP